MNRLLGQVAGNHQFIAIIAFLSSCNSGDRGELVGVKGKKWFPQKPYGMTLIPGGSFIMGKSDDDFLGVNDAPPKTVTVRSFYMDETEITNSEYRQFVYWVRDSIVRLRLAIMADEMGIGPEDGGIGNFAFVDQDEENRTPYEQYMYDNYYGFGDDFYEGRKVDNKVKLIWDTSKYPDEYYTEVMDTMYIPYDEAYNGLRTIDVTKLKFQYTYMDIEAAARNTGKRRRDFIKKEELEIYPDTTVWIRDFNYSYNEPMHNDYFWHEAYGDYPVVGVNWKQAKAFCAWRTLYKNAYQKEKGNLPKITLTTVQEYVDVCEYIQAQLSKIGLNIEVNVVPGPTMRDGKATGKFAFFRANWGADYPDAENFLSLYYSKNFAPEGPNYAHYKNQKFDELYLKSFQINDEKKRGEIYREMDSLMMQSAPIVPLFYDQTSIFTRKNVKGFTMSPVKLLNLTRVYKTKK